MLFVKENVKIIKLWTKISINHLFYIFQLSVIIINYTQYFRFC